MVYKASVPQSSLGVLHFLRDIWGGNIREKNAAHKYGWTKLPHWEWEVTGKKAYQFLTDIRPYLMVKIDRVEVMISIWECRLNHEERLVQLHRLSETGRASRARHAIVGSAGTIQPAEVAEMTTRHEESNHGHK